MVELDEKLLFLAGFCAAKAIEPRFFRHFRVISTSRARRQQRPGRRKSDF